jgi:hypothetical protein
MRNANGGGGKVSAWDMGINPHVERDARLAERAVPKEVRRRILIQDRQRFVAYDAHSLLESSEMTHGARPGHPVG